MAIIDNHFSKLMFKIAQKSSREKSKYVKQVKGNFRKVVDLFKNTVVVKFVRLAVTVVKMQAQNQLCLNTRK